MYRNADPALHYFTAALCAVLWCPGATDRSLPRTPASIAAGRVVSLVIPARVVANKHQPRDVHGSPARQDW